MLKPSCIFPNRHKWSDSPFIYIAINQGHTLEQWSLTFSSGGRQMKDHCGCGTPAEMPPNFSGISAATPLDDVTCRRQAASSRGVPAKMPPKFGSISAGALPGSRAWAH